MAKVTEEARQERLRIRNERDRIRGQLETPEQTEVRYLNMVKICLYRNPFTLTT